MEGPQVTPGIRMSISNLSKPGSSLLRRQYRIFHLLFGFLSLTMWNRSFSQSSLDGLRAARVRGEAKDIKILIQTVNERADVCAFFGV